MFLVPVAEGLWKVCFLHLRGISQVRSGYVCMVPWGDMIRSSTEI